jgi:hypothetical protein
MPFAYYAKLSPSGQRTYRKSDGMVDLALPEGLAPGPAVIAIRDALARDDAAGVQSACQALITALTEGYAVPALRVLVLAARPADSTGELHGLYEPDDEHPPARITLWMRTAALKNVVAFRTFLRTLIHELCHHLDYELFKLDDSFHTEGFYKRESSLANALFAAAGEPVNGAR